MAVCSVAAAEAGIMGNCPASAFSCAAVMACVCARAQQYEVIVRVVQSVAIAMMDVLIMGQLAAQSLLHPVAMLIGPSAGGAYFDFPVFKTPARAMETSRPDWYGTRMIHALHGHCSVHPLGLRQQGVKRKCLL